MWKKSGSRSESNFFCYNLPTGQKNHKISCSLVGVSGVEKAKYSAFVASVNHKKKIASSASRFRTINSTGMEDPLLQILVSVPRFWLSTCFTLRVGFQPRSCPLIPTEGYGIWLGCQVSPDHLATPVLPVRSRISRLQSKPCVGQKTEIGNLKHFQTFANQLTAFFFRFDRWAEIANILIWNHFQSAKKETMWKLFVAFLLVRYFLQTGTFLSSSIKRRESIGTDATNKERSCPQAETVCQVYLWMTNALDFCVTKFS